MHVRPRLILPIAVSCIVSLACGQDVTVNRNGDRGVVISANNRDPGLEAAVNDVLAAWQETTDCRDNPLLAHYLTVLGQTHWTITISTDDGEENGTGLDKRFMGSADPEDPRVGAPSIIHWNRFEAGFYKLSTVPKDPTASLIHELVHAAVNAEGTRVPEEWPHWEDPAPGDEAVAVRVENMYRRAHGLPMRQNYGYYTLTPDDYLPCCTTQASSCQDSCCAAGRDCSSGACVCQAGLIDCHGAQGGPCCAPGDSCYQGFYDSGDDPRYIPPYCCPVGTAACGYRIGGFPHPSQIACCTSDQTCNNLQGCVPRQQ